MISINPAIGVTERFQPVHIKTRSAPRSAIEESKVMTKLDLGGTAIWHDQVA